MLFNFHFRALLVATVITAVVSSPVPAKSKRAINCAPTDKTGSPLTSATADATDEFATCTYKEAGECSYFFANGNFGSGSSDCPAGLPQEAVSDTGSSSASSGSTAASTGNISPNVKCPATDKQGTALTASSDEGNDDFASCTYKGAGECEYFFASGDFSSGSSDCPAGLPQTAETTSTTAVVTPPTQATTSSTPPPPAATTTTSSTPPPPAVTTSSTPQVLSSTTTTSASLSAVAPPPAATSSSSTDTPALTTAAPPAPPATTPDDEASTTDVTITMTFQPSSTPGPLGAAGDGSTNAALGRAQAGTWGAVIMPVVVAVWAML
ncbi:hypothetical protein FB45DRAFT_920571 [Roridomyces roridus]|uniref:Uncharacterized protein n=1 Tax=Roridomyces roridus TaxID=1738132 RepID=A0AAD7BPK2_9AGAR|nr:hypothetical protein FB45DRAFT_920571 [Roridomyces roridus]